MGIARSRSPYGKWPIPKLVKLCRTRGITGVDENTPWPVLNTKLKAYDQEQEEIAIYRAVASDFGIVPPKNATRLELLALIEPAILAKLTKDGYFVPYGQGRMFCKLQQNVGPYWQERGDRRQARMPHETYLP